MAAARGALDGEWGSATAFARAGLLRRLGDLGAIKVSLATAQNLPTTAGTLNALLQGQWKSMSHAQQQATVGLNQPTYAEYVFQVAGALLTGPVTPGTKAAVYGLLAIQPGLTAAEKVTDPLGRVGTAIEPAAVSPSPTQPNSP